MKSFLRIVFFLVCLFLCIITGCIFDNSTMNTMYQVLGIIFSIGMGLIVSFKTSDIKNKTYLEYIRTDILYIRKSFMNKFGISTFFLIFYQKIPTYTIPFFKINIHTFANQFTMCLICISIVYFIVNFFKIQKLNNDIEDRINKELNK